MIGHPNLKAWFRADGDATDSSGNGKNGTYSGGYTTGVCGSAFNFTGTSYASVGAVGAGGANNVPYTVFARVYIDPAALTNGAAYNIVKNGDGPAGHAGYWHTGIRVYKADANNCKIQLYLGKSQTGDGLREYNIGTTAGWYSIAITDNGTSTTMATATKLFVNGVDASTVSSEFNPRTASTAYDYWIIGAARMNNNTYTSYSKCATDDVQIYNTNFSDADIKRITAGKHPLNRG